MKTITLDGITYKIENEATITNWDNHKSDLIIPHTVEGVPVTAIGDSAFFSSSIESIILPPKLLIIGRRSFKFCRNLKSIEFPSSVTTLMSECFFDAGIEKVFITENISSIENDSFTINKSKGIQRGIQEFSIHPDNPWYKKINSALCHVDGDDLVMEMILENIGSDYQVPEGVTKLSDSLFSYNLELTHIQLPESLLEIGNFAFYFSGIQAISLPRNLKVIGDYAFYSTKIHSIEIPTKVDSIGKSALSTKVKPTFPGRYLTGVKLDNDNKKYFIVDDVLYEKTSDTTNSLVLFFGPATSFLVPRFVTNIKEGAFINAPIQEIFLHKDIQNVEQDAFQQCKHLKRVTFELKKAKSSPTISLYFPFLDALYDDINAYLNCIHCDGSGDPIILDEYDRLFPIIRDNDEKIKVALSRLENPYKLSEKSRTNYHRFLTANIVSTFKTLCQWEYIEGVNILLEITKPNNRLLEIFLKYAMENGATPIIAIILEYKNIHHRPSDDDYLL